MRFLGYFLLVNLFILSSCEQKIDTRPILAVEEVLEECPPPKPQEVHFRAGDGLKVYADLYHEQDSLPFILVCHQAGYNKNEYRQIAPKLNKLGYNVLAIDMRSGGNMMDTPNRTHELALKYGKHTEYEDSEQDIIAATMYIEKKYHQKVNILASSYSASLALILATEMEQINTVMAFSPGEYFSKKDYLQKNIAKLAKHCFVSSSKNEVEATEELFGEQHKIYITQYQPKKDGIHGASALWETNSNHKEYWIALKRFLKEKIPTNYHPEKK